MYLLGYDIGSSTIKAALVDAQTRQPIAVTQYPDTDMDIMSRQSGWAEQQPEIWWQNVCIVTRRLLQKSGVAAQEVQAIGLGYQMHGLILIDKDQHVLRPSIIWCDSRAVEIGRQAYREIGQDSCMRSLLNSPGNFTASKLKWIKDNEPDIFQKIDKIMLPGDFIAMKMTGEVNTTISGLSEAILWDFQKNGIANALLDYYGFEKELLPNLVPTFSDQGSLSQKAAEMLGLKTGISVTYRAGDQPNNALALNVLNPGEIAATSGTSGVVYGIVDRPIYDFKSRVNAFAHVNYEEAQNRIGILLCLNGAGIQYSWIKHQIARGGTSYADMERMVSSVPVGSGGVCILPFGNGAERMLENRNLNAHIYNLQFNRHTRAHLYRAALEGVAFSFVYGINILKEIGIKIDVIRVGNDNMFQSPVFSNTIATLLGCQIEMFETTGAVGAAMAAGHGAGIYRSLKEALMGLKVEAIYDPNLHPGLCNQAYNYWLSCLQGSLSGKPQTIHANGKPGTNKLTEELVRLNRELTSSSFHLMQKKEILQELKEKISEIASIKDAAILQQELKKLQRLMEDKVTDNQEWENFEDHLNLLHNDFIKQLKLKFPQLNYDDLKLSTLLKMEMSTKEIASLLHISIRGVETRRYRLRKKLAIDKDLNFVAFFEQFE